MIFIRVPPALKMDYERLDESMKKVVRDKIRKLVGKMCFAELHFDPAFYDVEDKDE